MLIIRPERPSDAAAIHHINAAAFARPDEANLVDHLRAGDTVSHSLVAEQDGAAVGHILFSPVTVEDEGESWTAVALGPMAVLPSHQGQGIGSALVGAGLAACRAEGETAVFVLGHPNFYPRFGFTPAPPLGLRPVWDVPDEVFMVCKLEEGALDGRCGRVHYQPQFDGV